jgi:hypothetical protein
MFSTNGCWLGYCKYFIYNFKFYNMEITFDLKEDLITHTKLIENIEVVYKRKKRYSGELSRVKLVPFEVQILDEKGKTGDPEHVIDFDLAQQITLTFFDGTVKTYQDEIK